MKWKGERRWGGELEVAEKSFARGKIKQSKEPESCSFQGSRGQASVSAWTEPGERTHVLVLNMRTPFNAWGGEGTKREDDTHHRRVSVQVEVQEAAKPKDFWGKETKWKKVFTKSKLGAARICRLQSKRLVFKLCVSEKGDIHMSANWYTPTTFSTCSSIRSEYLSRFSTDCSVKNAWCIGCVFLGTWRVIFVHGMAYI